MAEVRAELLAFQRSFARREGGAVLDGRDIGTVICPKAEVKLFVTASAEVRARRRHQELVAGGTQIDFDQVLADVTTRDTRDAERAEAPMIAAVDAVVIDTSNLTIDAAIAVAVSIVQEGIIS
jgi:cytidylate kinase